MRQNNCDCSLIRCGPSFSKLSVRNQCLWSLVILTVLPISVSVQFWTSSFLVEALFYKQSSYIPGSLSADD